PFSPLALDLAKLRNTPSDVDLDSQIMETRDLPLRSGSQLISAESLAQVDADWGKWRAEWSRRKKIFISSLKNLLEESWESKFDHKQNTVFRRTAVLLCTNSGNYLIEKEALGI
ncbi:hypothetical protein MPER_08461, partial [Moniliophthora perniciosa FA553]